MHPADRYAELVSQGFRETPLLRVPADLSEAELQARWFSGEFGRKFISEQGEAVEIVQFGVWNREPGPDFIHAAVRFGNGEPIPGSIEFDPDVRDWERHGHGRNPAFDGVILHVYLRRGAAEAFSRTSQHRAVAQVQLSLECLGQEALFPAEAKPGRCVAPLARLPEEKVRGILHAAAMLRLRRKSAALLRVAALHSPDEALFQGLAAALGYKSNKLPFQLLAQRIPLRILRSEKENAEAILFGAAGFLPAGHLKDFDEPTRVYLRTLWERWWPLRAAFERAQIAPALWKLGGQRPVNHPQRRLAALARMVEQWPRLRSLAEACNPSELTGFFDSLTDAYWDRHYTVTSKTAPDPMALVGKSRVRDMLANVFYPLAVAADETRWDEYLKLPGSDENRNVKIAAVRLFGESPMAQQRWTKTAALQQGLLQVYEDFCLRDVSDCAACPFPTQAEKW